MDFHHHIIIPTLTGVNLTGFMSVKKIEKMYGPFASAQKVEPHSTFSADASGPYILSILFYTHKAS